MTAADRTVAKDAQPPAIEAAATSRRIEDAHRTRGMQQLDVTGGRMRVLGEFSAGVGAGER
jgi:hypothetical protein